MRYTRGGTDGELPVWPDVRTKSSPIFPQKLPKMAVTTVFASPVTFSKMTLNVIKYLGYFCKEKMSQRTVLNAQFGHTASSSKNWLFIWKSGSRIGRLVPTYTNTYVRIPTYLWTYTYLPMNVYLPTYERIPTYLWTYTYLPMNVYLPTYLWTYTYLSTYLPMNVYLPTFLWTYTYLLINVYLPTYERIPTYLCTYTYVCDTCLTNRSALFQFRLVTLLWDFHMRMPPGLRFDWYWFSSLTTYQYLASYFLVWWNPIRSNWRPAVQWYFPLSSRYASVLWGTAWCRYKYTKWSPSLFRGSFLKFSSLRFLQKG